jgi:hypothetical protein
LSEDERAGDLVAGVKQRGRQSAPDETRNPGHDSTHQHSSAGPEHRFAT